MLPESAPVLVADDSADDRFLLARCWAKAGIRNPIVEVEDGQRAIDLLSSAAPDDLPVFVLLDLKMPVRNGFEVLAWIRAHAVCRRLPVILLTASEQPGDIEKAYELGVNAFLVKPSSVGEMVELLEAIKGFWLRFNSFPRSTVRSISRGR